MQKLVFGLVAFTPLVSVLRLVSTLCFHHSALTSSWFATFMKNIFCWPGSLKKFHWQIWDIRYTAQAGKYQAPERWKPSPSVIFHTNRSQSLSCYPEPNLFDITFFMFSYQFFPLSLEVEGVFSDYAFGPNTAETSKLSKRNTPEVTDTGGRS